MADITASFHAAVKKHSSTPTLLKTTKQKKNISDFAVQAIVVARLLASIRHFLHEHQAAYVNAGRHLSRMDYRVGGGDGGSIKDNFIGFSDIDRDEVDSSCESLIQRGYDAIHALKQLQQKHHDSDSDQQYDNNDSNAYNQQRQHRVAVLDILRGQLRDVEDMHRGLKSQRCRLLVETSRLRHAVLEQQPSDAVFAAASAAMKEEEEEKRMSIDNLFSNEELLELEAENDLLLKEIHGMHNEATSVETTLVEIARLQDTFVTHLASQSRTIDDVHGTAIMSTDNMVKGNKDLDSAMAHNTDFRNWTLFFLLVLSFSLLFLDWYS